MGDDNQPKGEKSTEDDNYNLLQGRILASPSPGEEIVISGLSGTFPNSTDVYQFRYNLFNKVNMVLPNIRWDYVHPEIPLCSGTIPDGDKYDAGFFGVHAMQADAQDAMGRILLERAVEAVFDAGLSLSDMEGTNTGVYVGVCFSETEKSIFKDNMLPTPKHGLTGCVRSTLAQRISYFLKLRGPSFIADSACSSSLFALENAFRDLRLGLVDMAIVGGANMCFHPYVSMQFARLGVLSLDGTCKVFDAAGNGYARSETVGVILLQKSNVAKRKYSEIVYVKTNCDGFKEAGITYPSGDAQMQLLTEFYNDSRVAPSDLSYLEAHGTGTFVGDPEECNGVDEVLAKCRSDPLLIGSVKSNIGHTEPASGICSITKCIIALESGYIPPNIHFKAPRDTILGLVEGRMAVVTESMPFKDKRGLVGINSFGFGGGNCHVLLRGQRKEKIKNGLPQDNIPRVICVSGRNDSSIKALLDELKSHTVDEEFIRLLHDVFRKNISGHCYRGYSIVAKDGEICRFFEIYHESKTPLYFAFGELKQWFSIGKELMALPIFSGTIQKAQRLLLSKGINVSDSIFGKTENKTKYQVLGSILVQIALIDTFKALDLQPTNYFGTSYGELLAAYFDGIITFKQTVDCAFIINDVVDNINEICGPHQDIHLINRNNVNDKGFRSTMLSNFRTTFITPEFATIRNDVLTNLSNVLNKAKHQKGGKDEEKFGSAEYFVNALLENASSKIEYVEKSSVVLNFGALSTAAGKSLEDVKVISLLSSKDSSILVTFLKILGNLYVNGYNPQLAKFYPEVKFPVSRGTKMISPFIKWNHDRKWFTPSYNLQVVSVAQHGARKIRIQITDQQWSFIRGHVIDGRNLFPATGYLFLVWETLALIEEVPMTIKHIVFEDCKFLRATTVPKKGFVTFIVTVNRFSGRFEIVEGDTIIVTGKVLSRDNEKTEQENIYCESKKQLALTSKDVYKELRLRGYNYSGDFKSILQSSTDGSSGFIKWSDNWVTFMDNMLQLKILQYDSRLLYVPTYIAKLTLNAKDFLEWINTNYIKRNIETVLPVLCDKSTGEIRCKSLEIKGLVASSVYRRKDLGIPVLESYQFVPNITNLELRESVRVNTQIVLENSLLKKVKLVELIDDFTKNDSLIIPLIQATCEDIPQIQPLVKILSKRSIDTTIVVEDKEISNERDNDIVVGSQLLIRTQVLQMVYNSLKDNGFIITRESLDFDYKNMQIKDFTIFTIHTTPSEIIILLKKNSKPKPITSINVTDVVDFSWLENLKEIIKLKKSTNVLLYAQNNPLSGLLGFVNSIRREPESQFVKGLLILGEAEDFGYKKVFYKEQLDKNMAINIWKDNTWGTYRHLLLPEIENVQSEHCYVNSTLRGDLSSLRWIESTLKSNSVIAPERVLVRVQYAALNFRDIMTASGKINADVITENRLEQECVQGFEYSGIDDKGNRVMGMITQGALSTLVLADAYNLFKIPYSMSLRDASTIPVVYGTIIYGMLLRGKLQRNETVLIHSGTGGIGQAAIRMALHYGCAIFTTVGTEEKRKYLLKAFPQLKESNIGNSHDLSFEKMIRNGTHGRGVDMVLNSLAGEKLTASVRCLAHRGRFIEIGKFDLASNTELNLLLLEKEASFHGVMLDALMSSTPSVKAEISSILNNGIGNFVQPLPTTVFEYDQVEDAFRYMSTGKHMGKVLVKVREDEDMAKTSVQKFSGVARYICYSNETYIILGGLGGFGLELADWLILRGARNIVLTSRKGISTGYQKMRIRLWESYGVNIHISTDNMCTEDGCRQLLKKANRMGSVHAIFNLAVVLADCLFENQTENTFQTSFGPKALATTHLDKLSRQLCPNLKEFVIFSSIVCGRGNPGQTNYAMANSVMERICEKRRSEGYPALAIQWGAIGEVGLVAELQEEHVELEIGGTLQQKISSCLNVLNNFLTRTDVTIASSMVVAEKRGGLESCDNIVDTVLNILGLNDAKVVSHHATLPELGMDSMTGVEIKQTLEREFEVFLNPKDMKTMTLAKLKDIQKKKYFSSTETSMEDYLSIILGDLGTAEEAAHSEICLNPLQQTNNGSMVFCFPGVEGFAKKFLKVSSNLEFQTIGLQYSEKAGFQTVQEIAQNILPIVEKHIKPNEKVNFIGYSFGSLVALEIAHLLESKGFIGNLVIVDGGPVIMKKLAERWTQESSIFFETMLMCHLLSFYLPLEATSQHREKLLKCNNWEERVNVSYDLIKQTCPDDVDHLSNLANGIYYRIRATEAYTPSFEKLKSKIKLFKPSKATIKDIEGDYGLTQISESPVEVEVFEGNHGTILGGDQIAQSINILFTQLCLNK